MPVENNENPSVCSKCGGACCKRVPGIYAPEQFGAPNKKTLAARLYRVLLSGVAQVDWWEGDPRPEKDRRAPKTISRGYFIRPTVNDGYKDKIEDSSWGGPCINLIDSGCSLPFEERPIVCQLLVPCVDNPDKGCKLNSPVGDSGDEKRDSAVAWVPYHRQIQTAVARVERARLKMDDPVIINKFPVLGEPTESWQVALAGIQAGKTAQAVQWAQEYPNNIPGLRAGSTFMGEPCNNFASVDCKSIFINPPFNELGCTGVMSMVPPPHIEISSACRASVDGSTGRFKFEWPSGYLESIPEGVVELASTESNGVRYRFCVERVVE